MKEKTVRKVPSREDGTYIALTRGEYVKIADMLAEANGYKVEYDSDTEDGDTE